jgi:NAD(P)H-hydrate repair Nnr-like enzyme with NAD(P)H-hydrate dehydratase domain
MADHRVISAAPPLPDRPREGHKGTFGRVLVVGGNDGMIGAPVLAGTAALRMGAGLVQIAVPRAILPYALSITPELIGIALGKAAGKDQLLVAAGGGGCDRHRAGIGQDAGGNGASDATRAAGQAHGRRCGWTQPARQAEAVAFVLQSPRGAHAASG